MIINLDIPAGFYRVGTDLEQSNRWRDGSLVRWRDGSLRPVGGWRERKANFSTNPIRGMHAWESNNDDQYVAGGSATELKVMIAGGILYDVTPSDLVAGLVDADVSTGFGKSFYGTSYYGTPRPDTGNFSEATTWAIDNFGERLVACSVADGRLLEWALGSSADAAVISNAPINNLSLVVTEERFLFALGAGGNPRRVSFSDRENNTLWTAASTNEAGGIELQTSGQIMCGLRTQGQTLLITDVDAHSARYIGPPYVYSFQRVGSSCGIISRKAACDTQSGTFWMGTKGFYRFDGNSVQEIPCGVHDLIFDDINTSQQSKVWALSNGQFSEVWWFYASANSNEIDSYVALDYAENHWLMGKLARTSGTERGVFKYPFMTNLDVDLIEHEIGANYDNSSVFAETGPISLGSGDQVMSVTQLIPDEKTQGDVDIKFKTRLHPNGAETDHGSFNPSNPTSVRFSGRQMRMRIDGDNLVSWRVGNMRVDARPMGRR